MDDDGRLSGPERQRRILETARQQGRVRVNAVAQALAVTPETVRKDLEALQAEGLIMRVHGGGIPVETPAYEPGLTARTEWTAEKERIGRAALAEVPAGGVIFVEAGSTTARFAELIPADLAVTVVTNSLPIAQQLATRSSAATVVILGGRVRAVTLGSVDALAIRNLQTLYADVAFLGTNGMSLERGLTTPDIAEAETKRAALSCSNRRVLLADHSKVGRVSFCRYGELGDIDHLITDTGLPAQQAAELGSTIGRVTRV
ncbi:DeoR family fructose operon transcriptional repressor [Kineococcus radiotolerans]|uniref:Lactose phosphotransferase system repressor n=1 Tax=Kineococcus radiotolerans TaxID=131568 RepID=A0A7W4TRU3_KINRA|nr:DeoR/GlpR family DNA-binding transcription regulator [Kineococcus radiotolerans]MBB2903567.1 DeoR family fructose operon transcriptional repressor [Kineococcus radiotolerans]